MALTKQQKFDMIHDVELRLAKEELVEQHVKNMAALEDSEKPMQTLKDIIDKKPSIQKVYTPKEKPVAGQALRQYQRDEWHTLNQRHFEELKSLPANTDLQKFATQKQEELEKLLRIHRLDMERVETCDTPLLDEQAIIYSYEHLPNPEIMARPEYRQTDADKELLHQSEEAAKTPFTKPGLDSRSKWEFEGLEIQAMRDVAARGFDIKEQFENAQSISNDNDMDMEL